MALNNVTTVAVNDGGGGGDWELSLSISGLEEAASSYTTAAGQYSTALDELKTNLKSALDSWQDESKADWEAKVEKAIGEMTLVKKRMESNASVLNEIAGEARATQTEVQSGISSL